jgi:hypothetical protein
MSAAVPQTKSGAPLIPPDEQFWKRYSPHGEAPLSVSGSLALHVLIGGGLLLAGIYLAALLYKPDRSLPVEPVRLKIEGGGGGRPDGHEKGVKGGGMVEDTGGEVDKELQQAGVDDAPRKPALEPVERKQIEKVYDSSSTRYISESTTAQAKKFAGLEQKIRSRLALADRPAGKGMGGPGTGGGKGTGEGKGEGPGKGEGKATLSKREKRMLRWHMIFTANSGPEYLLQLRGLGAILAFPVGEGPDPEYKVVRELRPGAPLLDEDVSKIQRIYWIDDKPRSVVDILNALRLKLPRTPGRFVAFMPEKLEEGLFKMEKRYVEQILRTKFDEDKIDETRFRVVFKNGRYQPEIISVLLKR